MPSIEDYEPSPVYTNAQNSGAPQSPCYPAVIDPRYMGVVPQHGYAPFAPSAVPFAPYSTPNNNNAARRPPPSSQYSSSDESRHPATPRSYKSTPPTSARRGNGPLSIHGSSSKITKPAQKPDPPSQSKGHGHQAQSRSSDPAICRHPHAPAGEAAHLADPLGEYGAPAEAPSAADILSHNSQHRLSWQIRVARYLLFNGINGPYEVGDSLCEVDPTTAKVERFASRDGDYVHGTYWTNIFTNECHPEIKDEGRCGAPAWGSDGSFRGYVEKGRLEPAPAFLAKSNLREVFYGAREYKSPLKYGNNPMWN
ncbi:hypothetical protein PT974_06389 [Cladobotryum mycophilum]|uniref:Uncharacterized protein n=1 Tax=Cladobotryum mycophilum TaxID=491253 RepID=A0ABR0SLB9_9HYPO